MVKFSKTVMLVLFMSFGLFAQNNNISDVNEIIKSVKKMYAPDKRVALFNVEAVKKGEGFALIGETNNKLAKDELLKKLPGSLIMEDNIKVLPEEQLGDRTFGIVNLSVANLRFNHQHSSEMATQTVLGTPVKVLKKVKYWYYIQTPDGYLAWVDDDGIELVTKEQYTKWVSDEKVVYLEDYGFTYSKPEVNSQRVSDIVAGSLLKFVEENNGFVKVAYPDGREAYIESAKVKNFNDWFEGLTLTQESIVAKAHTYMGIPYLWGGTSTKGMDCSGFTKTVYRLHGIILKRDASQQVHTGNLVTETVDFDKLQPGDLMFFGEKATDEKAERVTHVGIYIGDTEFIHESGKVKINSLSKDRKNFTQHRYDTFIRARRVLDSVGENEIETFKDNKFYNGELK